MNLEEFEVGAEEVVPDTPKQQQPEKQKKPRKVIISPGEPCSLSKENYDTEVNQALSWYNMEIDNSKKKQWAIEFLDTILEKSQHVPNLLKVDEYHFRTFGTLVRMLSNGCQFKEQELNHIKEGANKLIEMAIIAGQAKPSQSINKNALAQGAAAAYARANHVIRKLSGEIDVEIDKFFENNGQSEFTLKPMLLSYELGPGQTLALAKAYGKQLEEFQMVLDKKDDQLVEAYAHISRPIMKRAVTFLQSLVDDCKQRSNSARMPRKHKRRDPLKVVARMKYKREDPDLKLRSVSPVKVVGAAEVWVYNTKLKKLMAFRAEDPDGITVKGTSLIGFSLKESETKTLRKPEVFFKDIETMTKRPLTKAFIDVRGKTMPVKPRMSEDCVIVKVF